jgi:hypothetical protein
MMPYGNSVSITNVSLFESRIEDEDPKPNGPVMVPPPTAK